MTNLTPERRERLERAPRHLVSHEGGPFRVKVVIDEDAFVAAIIEIDRLTDALAHIKTLVNNSDWGPLGRLAMIEQVVNETIGRPSRLRPPTGSGGRQA